MWLVNCLLSLHLFDSNTSTVSNIPEPFPYRGKTEHSVTVIRQNMSVFRRQRQVL